MSDETSQARSAARAAGEEANRAMGRQPISPFSPRAFDQVQSRIRTYIEDLVELSVRSARRHNAEVTGATDVERAADYLASRAGTPLSRYLGTLGGFLAGAAVAQVLTFLTTGSVTGAAAAVTIAVGIGGGFLVAFAGGRD